VISYIDAHYDFTPSKNGNTRNEEGQNNGSCKIFGFASYHGLTKEETLPLFGNFTEKMFLKTLMEQIIRISETSWSLDGTD
jgi:hypothetical protein